MRLPLRYTMRNLWTRKLTTLLTAGGMALVVFVFAAVLMLASEGGNDPGAQFVRLGMSQFQRRHLL